MSAQDKAAKKSPPPAKPQPQRDAALPPEENAPAVSGRELFFAVIGLTVLVLLIALIFAAGDRKDWSESLNGYAEAQQLISEGEYGPGLEILQGLSPSYQDSPHVQLLMGTCCAGLAEEAKTSEDTEQALSYMEAAASHLERARAANFQLVQSQGYVNGYGKIMLELGRYEVAQQYFLQSIQLNTYEELTAFAQENLESIKTLAAGGVVDE